MASELAPVGSSLWHLDALPVLIPSGRVRVSPSATFTFCRADHPLCTSGAYPLPSRVVPSMSGAEFVERISRGVAGQAGAGQGGAGHGGMPPLFYADSAERYYLQADLSSDVVNAKRVPALWKSIFGAAAQAQPLRLWVSTYGATTPLHFDAAHSFLAQMRGSKRITFFPPHALSGLYPYPADHPLHRRGRVNLYADAAERDAVFPRFARDAAPAAQTISLIEGDVVLFPRHWWHHIETTSALSCSVGCRYV